MDNYQATFLKNFDMPGDSRSADTKFFGYTIEGESLSSQQTQNGSSVGIGNCLKNVSSHILYVTVRLPNYFKL
jgi:hypothetical protein